MAQPGTFVGNLRSDVTAFLAAWEKLKERLVEYNQVGGSTFINPYWFQSDGTTPRTDLDITKQNALDALSTVGNIQTLMDAGNGTNLYKLKQ